MTDRAQSDAHDPRHHTQRLKQMLDDTAAHAWEDVTKVSDPRAQALVETTAEVVKNPAKAFDDFEQMREKAWEGSAKS